MKAFQQWLEFIGIIATLIKKHAEGKVKQETVNRC